jgi:hypothetical protein
MEPKPTATPTSGEAEDEANVGEKYQAQKKAIFQLGLVIDRSIASSLISVASDTMHISHPVRRGIDRGLGLHRVRRLL